MQELLRPRFVLSALLVIAGIVIAIFVQREEIAEWAKGLVAWGLGQYTGSVATERAAAR